MNEELKKANDKLQMQVWKAIASAVACGVALLYIIFGAAYLFNVGGLFIKLLSLAVGAAFVMSGVDGITNQLKQARVLNKLLKVGKIFESVLDKHAELNK